MVVHVTYLDIQRESYFELPGTNPDDIEENSRAEAEKIFEKAESVADNHEADIETKFLIDRASNAIVSYAEKNDFDQIVICTHGRESAFRVLLGSVAEKVTRRSHAPTTIVK